MQVRSFKYKLLVIAAMVLLASCQSDDTPETSILGEWKLIMQESYSSGNFVIDYSDNNIIYKFNSNGTVEVTGGESVNYATGTFDYYIEKQIASPTSPNAPRGYNVTVDRLEYEYYNEGGKMRLSQLHIDGPQLVFVRN